MTLRERAEQAANTAPSDRAFASHTPGRSLAAFTAGEATAAVSRSSGLAAAAGVGDDSREGPLSFLRVSPSRARALQVQFEHEQRRFDAAFEPTAVPDAQMPVAPAGRDELDPSHFRS